MDSEVLCEIRRKSQLVMLEGVDYIFPWWSVSTAQGLKAFGWYWLITKHVSHKTPESMG